MAYCVQVARPCGDSVSFSVFFFCLCVRLLLFIDSSVYINPSFYYIYLHSFCIRFLLIFISLFFGPTSEPMARKNQEFSTIIRWGYRKRIYYWEFKASWPLHYGEGKRLVMSESDGEISAHGNETKKRKRC